MTKTAIITGASGQDGTLLSKLLLQEGYEVTGLIRPNGRIHYNEANQHLKQVEILDLDINDADSMNGLIKSKRPDQLYHLAACHHESTKGGELDTSLDSQMIEVNFSSTKNLIHAIIDHHKPCRFFYAGSSQMFTPKKNAHLVNEESGFDPSTFYGHTKLWSAQLIEYYRTHFGFWGCSGILFNHESIYRPEKFITRMITKAAAEIKSGHLNKLQVRNPFAKTDWSSASDFVRAFYLMLSAKTPEDYIISSGVEHKVMDVIKYAFGHLGLDETRYLSYDPSVKEPEFSLMGDNTKLKNNLNWEPQQTLQSTLVEMVEHDLKLLG